MNERLVFVYCYNQEEAPSAKHMAWRIYMCVCTPYMRIFYKCGLQISAIGQPSMCMSNC